MKNALTLCLLFIVSLSLTAQKKQVSVTQADSRFTLKVEKAWAFGTEDYWFYVENNTGDEYQIVVSITLELACNETRYFDLGFSGWDPRTSTTRRTVNLQPFGSFAPKDDNFHSYSAGVDDGKGCRLTDGSGYTLYKGLQYRIHSIVNVTQEKAREEQKQKDAEALKQQKAEADKKAKDEKETADKKEKEDKEEADKKQGEEAKKKAEDEEKRANEKNSSSSGSGSSDSESETSTGTEKSTSTYKKSKKEIAEEKAAADKARIEQEKEEAEKREAARAEAERARIEKEKNEFNNRIAAQNAVNAQTATSIAQTSTEALIMLAEILYGDMGSVSEDNLYTGSNFHFGMNYGFSFALLPRYFASEQIDYASSTKTTKNTYNWPINLDLEVPIGYDYKYVGGYVFGRGRGGITLTGTGYLLEYGYGGRIYAGHPNIKAMFEYEAGQVLSGSIWNTDAKEKGKAYLNYTFDNFKVGLTGSWYPSKDGDCPAARHHLTVGIVEQRIKKGIKDIEFGPTNIQETEKDNVLANVLKPFKNNESYLGFFLEWHQDHFGKLSCSVFPKYPFTGSYTVAPTDKDNGFYIHIGYIKTWDFYIKPKRKKK